MSKYLLKINNRSVVMLVLCSAVYWCGERCTSRDTASSSVSAMVKDSYGKAFAGAASCGSCHPAIYASHLRTAHYRDSRRASAEAIKGSLDSGKNHFVYTREWEVTMERRSNGFFQTAFHNGRETKTEAMDLVIGAGRKGQTYLYWDSGKLYQLPVSYFSPMDSWCNSPGYPDSVPLFSRTVPAFCLECHTTYAKTVFHTNKDYGDYFDSSQIVYGIDCEKCHGPGADHVAYQETHPGEKTGRYIINTRLLSRQQRLDACALCHSGSRYPLRPPFSFRAGDHLNEYSEAKYQPDSVSTLDVHGNQYGLLTSSKCYRLSQMDCSTCHNPHADEASELKLFSQKCLNCHHQPATPKESSDKADGGASAIHKDLPAMTGGVAPVCAMRPRAGLVLANNCIDCHMPALPSKKIVLSLSNVASLLNGAAPAGRTIANLVRTHHIAIYPQATKEYLEKLKTHH